VADSMANDSDLFAADLRAKAMQAVEGEWSATADPALERRDLAREGVKEKNQSRDLILDFRNACLSEPSDASRIVPVVFTLSLFCWFGRFRYPPSVAIRGGAV
jgi:hypothetical protein